MLFIKAISLIDIYEMDIGNVYLCTIYYPVNLFCSSKDILLRVVAQNLSPETTLVEKVVMILLFEVTILERFIL